MDQIRNTMMQHEALFKEQVQALHKLYNIQRLAMQDIRRRIYSHAQVLTFSSERLLADDQVHGSILEGKPLRPVYATARAGEEESLALTLRPFLLVKEFKGSGSLWMNGKEIENFHTPQKEPIRNFDIEKLPEDSIGEPEILVRSNNSEMVDMKSSLCQRTDKTKENSIVSLSSVERESQILKQISLKTDLRLFTITSQEFNQNDDQASEGKTVDSDVKNYVTDTRNSNNATEKYTSKEVVWNYCSDIFQDLSPSTNEHIEKRTLLHHQGIGFDSGTTTGSKSKKLISCGTAEVYLPKNPSIRTQDPSILESLQCKLEDDDNFFLQKSLHLGASLVLRNQSRHLSALMSQTIMDGSNDNSKDSSNENNSILSQDRTSCENKNNIAHAETTSHLSALMSQTIMDGSNDNSKDSSNENNSILSQDRTSRKNKNNIAHAETTLGPADYSCEKRKMSNDGRDIVELERQESPQFIQDGSRNSFCLNSEPESVSSLDEAILNDSNEDVTGKSVQHEETESIAAKILLSFAPCRKLVESEFNCSQTKAESGKSSRDNDKNVSLCEMKDAKGGSMNDSIKWAKSVSRRRTLRRPR